MRYKEDYKAAGVPMLPVVAGAAETRRQIVLYSCVLVPLTLAPWALGFTGIVYGLPAAALGIAFLGGALRVAWVKTEKAARDLFAFSILYLFLLFALIIADALLAPLGRGLWS